MLHQDIHFLASGEQELNSLNTFQNDIRKKLRIDMNSRETPHHHKTPSMP
jgi:hypothetical protein